MNLLISLLLLTLIITIFFFIFYKNENKITGTKLLLFGIELTISGYAFEIDYLCILGLIVCLVGLFKE